MSYPGKPSVSAAHLSRSKPNREAAIPPAGRGQGVADPRIVADDSGPMKPGNSVEDKTLTTESPSTDGEGNGAMVTLKGHEAGNSGYSQEVTYRHRALSAPGQARTSRWRQRDVGSRGRKARVTAWESRDSEGPKKPEKPSWGRVRSWKTPKRVFPRRLEPFRLRPQGQAFPAISDDRPSRRKVA